MQCPRCLNTDRSYFYKGSKGWYCRKCISFGRVMLEEDSEPEVLDPVNEGSEEYTLQYPLTEAQEQTAVKCVQLIDTGDVLLHCVCGAGKTELVVYSIAKMLKRKKKVCFAIPRRQVVLELGERLAEYFPNASVAAVCGGHTQITDGDLIICTTHQLYRYYQAFDLLILDEPDAFPYRGNDVLHGIVKTACRGHMIYLTATPDEKLMNMVKEKRMTRLVLNSRPHGHPVPEPVIVTGPALYLFFRLADWLKEHRTHPRMIFVPTIRTAEILYRIMRRFIPCCMVSSHSEDRDAVIEEYRKQKNGIIIATTVLERGVTIPGADICVLFASHPVFDEAGLIQMAGRAGRSFKYPDGDVLFLSRNRSDAVLSCRKTIMEANHALSAVSE